MNRPTQQPRAETSPSDDAVPVHDEPPEHAAQALWSGFSDDEPETLFALSSERLQSVLESLLFASDKPLPTEQIHDLLEETAKGPVEKSGPPLYTRQTIDDALGALAVALEKQGRGIGLLQVAGGWQLRTAVQNAPFVQRLLKQKPVRLSRAQLETLSIVAYRQPVTRPEIDDIRGVDSGAALRTLLDRNLVRILGKKEEPGRPLLWGTTRDFLEFFHLKDLKELPTLREYQDLSDEGREAVQAAGFELPTLISPKTAHAESPEVGESASTPSDERAVAKDTFSGLLEKQLADDADNLARIDEMIRTVQTAFPLLDPNAHTLIPSPKKPEPTENDDDGMTHDLGATHAHHAGTPT